MIHIVKLHCSDWHSPLNGYSIATQTGPVGHSQAYTPEMAYSVSVSDSSTTFGESTKLIDRFKLALKKKTSTKAEQVMSVKILWCLFMNRMVPNLCMSVVNGSSWFYAGAEKSGLKKRNPSRAGHVCWNIVVPTDK